MAIERFDDILAALRDHPEWRDELRRLVLTDELLALPQLVARLVEGQDALRDAIGQLTARMDQLAARMDDLAGHVGELRGSDLERRYRDRAPAYFSRIARRIHLLTNDELEELVDEAERAGHLDASQVQELRVADAVIRGRRGDQEVFLVVEVTWTIDPSDVRRAQERADVLRRTGREAIPVVAGKVMDRVITEAAVRDGVWCVLDGRTEGPEAA